MESKPDGLVCKLGGVTYRLLELIGEGTFGKVYKGVNETTREYVAVKIVNTTFTLGTQKKQTSVTAA